MWSPRLISVTEWARLHLSTAAAAVLLLAISLGVPRPSWALDVGTYTGTATRCVLVSPEGLFQRVSNLDAVLEVTSSNGDLRASGIAFTGQASLSLQGDALQRIVGLSHRGWLNYTSSGVAEVVVQADGGSASLSLTCERSGPVGFANRNKCQGTYVQVSHFLNSSAFCPAVRIKNY